MRKDGRLLRPLSLMGSWSSTLRYLWFGGREPIPVEHLRSNAPFSLAVFEVPGTAYFVMNQITKSFITKLEIENASLVHFTKQYQRTSDMKDDHSKAIFRNPDSYI